MKKFEDKKKVKKKLDETKYLEKLEILRKAKEQKQQQLFVDIEENSIEIKDRLKEILNKSFDDPDKKHQLYYNGIRKVLMDYLPKGKEFKTERDIIYDEKNIFLNRGYAKDENGVRGRDGRMTYNEDMGEMADLIADWVMTSQDPVDLYQKIYDLNDKYGYGHQNYDESSKGFHLENSKNKKRTS